MERDGLGGKKGRMAERAGPGSKYRNETFGYYPLMRSDPKQTESELVVRLFIISYPASFFFAALDWIEPVLIIPPGPGLCFHRTLSFRPPDRV